MAGQIQQLDDEIRAADLSPATMLGQGRTAEVYLFRERYVVKLFRPSFPKPAIENEYLVCRAIDSFVNIPKVYEHLIIDGRDAIVFDFIKGDSGFKYLFRNPWTVRKFAEQFALIHAKIHSTSVPEEVPELKSILIRNINLNDILPKASKEKVIDYLQRLPAGNTLCHGDYHPDNILLLEGKPFVLDWMTATRGHPLADVARTSALLKWAQPGPGVPAVFRALLSTVRKRFYERYIAHYLKITGVRIEEVERWELPILAARLMEWIPKSEKELLVSIIHEKLKRIL
jgi:hypothetical protein